MKSKLWTKNYTLCFIGTILSALGGIGLNVAMSVLVFKETQSTALSGMFAAISMIPNFVLPVFMGSFIDRKHPLKVLVCNEVALGAFFMIVSFLVTQLPFNYLFYLVITLCISTFGVISELAYQSVTPHIMDRKMYPKGNAALSTIYPMAQIVMTPIALFLFNQFGVALIFLFYGFTCWLDASLESRIKFEYELPEKVKENRVKQHISDIKDGFFYLKEHKAISSVFIYFFVTMMVYGLNVLYYPYFTQTAGFGDANYSLLLSINGLGYLLGGFFHYFVQIPHNRRFQVTVIVYLVFNLLEGTFFAMPLIIMFATKLLLGMLGMNTANIRTSALQAYVPNKMRAKVNAMYSVMVSIGTIIGQALAGWMAEFMPYIQVSLILGGLGMIAVIVFIMPPKNKVKEFLNFNYTEDVKEVVVEEATQAI